MSTRPRRRFSDVQKTKVLWIAKSSQWGSAQRFLVMYRRSSRISFFSLNRSDGYRRCAYVMIDKDVAYAGTFTMYRVLKEAGMIQKKADDARGVVKFLNSL